MLRSLKLLIFVVIAVGISLVGSAHIYSPVYAAGKSVPKIAFVLFDDQTKTHILSIADPDGKHVVHLLKDAFFYNPTWSPDGTKLAFIGGQMNSSVITWNLYLINSDGTGLQKLSSHPSRQNPGNVTWSPDGQQLIYSVRDNGDIDGFYKIKLDGSGEQRLGLVGLPLTDGWITWAPDSKQLAILAQTESQPYYAIYLTDSNGENFKPLVVTGANHPIAPFNYLAWSPDQQHMFLYLRPDTPLGPSEIDEANNDGSEAKVVLGTAPKIPNNMSSLSVSPDGKQILFIANEPDVDFEPQLALWIANANGSGLHVLGLRGLYAGGTSWGMIPQDELPKGEPLTLPAPAP